MHLLIYGSGGLGKEVVDLARRINAVEHHWDIISFIDDFREGTEYYGIHVYKFPEILQLVDIECIVAQGEPKFREMLYNKLVEQNIPIATLVDPTAIVSSTAKIGVGSIISALVLIHSEVEICENVLIQPLAVIGHDIHIGKHSVFSASVMPGGADYFGERVYIGMSTVIREKLTIGDDVIISMGSVVQRNIEAGLIVMGNPARPMLKNEDGKVFHK